MKDLIYKELKLALHPTSALFILLSAMLLIPSYPYYVVFFYTTLGIFFICLSGRENSDIFYMMLLPVRKRDIVRARFATVVCLEGAQLLMAVPFAVLRTSFNMPNEAGMDANTALFGLALVMYGIFNFAFFSAYYRDPSKVGKAFVSGSICMVVYFILAEASTFVVPFMKAIDTPDPEMLGTKLCVLFAGAFVYAILTIAVYHKAVKSFEKLDL